MVNDPTYRSSPYFWSPCVNTMVIRLSVTCMINGDTPRAAIDRISLPCGRIICADMRRLALSDVRNLITHAALIAWDMTVAMAAPLIPRFSANMNIGSRMMLHIAPMRTEAMAVFACPWAVINVFSPVVIMTNIVPIR